MGTVQLNEGQINKMNKNKILLLIFFNFGMKKIWPQREVRFLVKMHFESEWYC